MSTVTPPSPITVVATPSLLDAISQSSDEGVISWGKRESMAEPLNPLDDPLGAMPVDQMLQMVTLIFKTGAAAASFTAAVIAAVRQLRQPARIHDGANGKIKLVITPKTTENEITNALDS